MSVFRRRLDALRLCYGNVCLPQTANKQKKMFLFFTINILELINILKMAFEIEKLLMDIANSKSLNAIFNNPIYTAMIIVSVVLIIIYFCFHNDVAINEDSDTSMMTLMFTSGIYCILAVLGVVYLQHRAMVKDFEQKYSSRANDEVVRAAIDGTTLGSFEGNIYNPEPVFQELDGSVDVNVTDVPGEDSSEKNARIRKLNKFTKKEKKLKQQRDDEE